MSSEAARRAATEIAEIIKESIDDIAATTVYEIDNTMVRDWTAWLQPIIERHTNQWIAVAERLPEVRTTVLMTDGKTVGSGYLDSSGQLICCAPERFDGPGMTQRTHWRPLPPAPEQVTS